MKGITLTMKEKRLNDILVKFISKEKANEEKDYIIISKSYDYLLTIDGTKIMIKDIIEIN